MTQDKGSTTNRVRAKEISSSRDSEHRQTGIGTNRLEMPSLSLRPSRCDAVKEVKGQQNYYPWLGQLANKHAVCRIYLHYVMFFYIV